MASIAQPTQKGDAGDAFNTGIKSGIDAYHMGKQNKLLDEESKAKGIANESAQMKLTNEQESLKQMQTPGSPLGEAVKQGYKAAIGLSVQAYPIKDQSTRSALDASIKSLDDPNISAYQASQVMNANPFLADIKSFAEKKMAADASANKLAGIVGVKQDDQTSRAVDTVTKDPQLASHIQRIQGLGRVKSQIDDIKSGKLVDTEQLVNEINSEYVNAMTGSNNAALGKQERTEYKTAAGKWANIKQTITGNPESIKSPEIIKQIEDQVNSLNENYQSILKTRAKSLQREYRHNPDATKAQQKAIEDLIANYGSNSNTSQPYTPTAQEAAAELARRQGKK
jgi:hypothetical protein